MVVTFAGHREVLFLQGCSVCGVGILLAILHCCILAVSVELKGGMRYCASVVLHVWTN